MAGPVQLKPAFGVEVAVVLEVQVRALIETSDHCGLLHKNAFQPIP